MFSSSSSLEFESPADIERYIYGDEGGSAMITSDEDEDYPESWISSFCSVVGHEYFAEVSEDFIADDFNLTGLSTFVPSYKEALELILDIAPEDEDDDGDDEIEEETGDDGLDVFVAPAEARATVRLETQRRKQSSSAANLSAVESSAELLYGLIHQRFITSRVGMPQMAQKYELQHFGFCPRVHCQGCRVLPVGTSDEPGRDTVKLFCPACLEIYVPPSSRYQNIDGAFFGTTFPHLFFMSFTDLEIGPLPEPLAYAKYKLDHRSRKRESPRRKSPSRTVRREPKTVNGMLTCNIGPGLGAENIYEPKIYGFRVSERAKSGPRMKWLRMKPADITELDETRNMTEAQEIDEYDSSTPQ